MPNPLYAILSSPCIQYEATRRFIACTGRKPERVHFTYGWWWLGWMSGEEGREWKVGTSE